MKTDLEMFLSKEHVETTLFHVSDATITLEFTPSVSTANLLAVAGLIAEHGWTLAFIQSYDDEGDWRPGMKFFFQPHPSNKVTP